MPSQKKISQAGNVAIAPDAQTVILGGVAAYGVRSRTSAQLFGVDTIAMANTKAYVCYPTLSGASNNLRVVAVPVQRIYLPLVVR